MVNTSKMTFKPAWWLSNPHLQTLFPTFARRNKTLNFHQRERLYTKDNDFIDIDWCLKETNKPLVILLHGLTGSSQSSYIIGLQRTFSQYGWRSIALNFRGCSGEPNNLARSYHSGDTEDLHFLYQMLRQREPETPIAIIGFSLGGNVLLKWLGEQGTALSLVAAIAVSVPLQLDICATKLGQSWSRIYQQHLLSRLITYIKNKQDYLESKRLYKEANKIAQLGDLHGIKSFWEYDERVIARLYNFKDVHEYYKLSSSRQFLKNIQIPTKIIQALDDPFMTKEVLPEPNELSPFVQLEVSRGGGHVGFISGNNPFKPNYWIEQSAPDFFIRQGLIKEIDFKKKEL